MPEFIPPYMGEEVKSNAERKVFDLLKGLDMKEAVILHSLGLPRHNSKIFGEVDFVIVCKRGIACLEIKGGRVERQNGIWRFTDRNGNVNEKTEGPFDQCKGNMFNLRNEIRNNMKHINNILFTWGVMFPDINFNVNSEDIPNEVIFDAGTENINEYIKRIYDYGEERDPRDIRELSPANIKEIVSYLKRDFTFVETLSVRLNESEKRILRLTEAQSMLLYGFEDNDKLMIKGGAGTGKTLMAMEYAKRQLALGKSVLLLTYNKNLANSIKRQTADAGEKLNVINIHGLFGQYIPFSKEKLEGNGNKYFKEVLPDEFYNYVKNLDSEELDKIQYDVLIMDEAQDILKPNYIECIDFLLKGGFEKGRWAVFYDEKQNIYNPEFENGLEEIDMYSPAKFKLVQNCRNTYEIASFTARVTNTENSILAGDNRGVAVSVLTFENDSEFRNVILDLMKKLKNENISCEEIVFLSPRSYEKSRMSSGIGEKIKVNILKDGFTPEKDRPVFATIQGFKGLDAKIVIFVDADKIYEKVFSELMYTGCSRARSMLYIVTSKESAERFL